MKTALRSSRRSTVSQRLKRGLAIAQQAMFVLGTDPPATTTNSGADRTLGVLVNPDKDILVSAIWFRQPGVAFMQPAIWDGSGGASAGPLLGSGPMISGVAAGTWQRLPLSAPVQMFAGQQYAIGVFATGGSQYFTTYNGSGSDYVDGGATLTPVTLTGTNYGRYSTSSALAYPDSAVADANPKIFSMKIEGVVGGRLSYSYSGAPVSIVVPTGAKSMFVDLYGAEGGPNSGQPGGKGGRLQASLSVTAGEKLQVNVGGIGLKSIGTNGGPGGWNGGGNAGDASNSGSGGGATDIRRRSSSAGPALGSSDSSASAGSGGQEGGAMALRFTPTADMTVAGLTALLGKFVNSDPIVSRVGIASDFGPSSGITVDNVPWLMTDSGVPAYADKAWSELAVDTKVNVFLPLPGAVALAAGTTYCFVISTNPSIAQTGGAKVATGVSVGSVVSQSGLTIPSSNRVVSAAATGGTAGQFLTGVDAALDFTLHAPYGLGDRIAVAGGGGGVHVNSGVPGTGHGGGLTGAGGGTQGGGGGTQSAGGAGGSANGAPGENGVAGTLGIGGRGGNNTSNIGGGGGGGYYGGGGGGSGSSGSGSGGGGSSYTVPTAVDVTHTQGNRSGNGLAVVTFSEQPLPATFVQSANSGNVTTASATASFGSPNLQTGNLVLAMLVIDSDKQGDLTSPSGSTLLGELEDVPTTEYTAIWTKVLSSGDPKHLVQYTGPSGSQIRSLFAIEFKNAQVAGMAQVGERAALVINTDYPIGPLAVEKGDYAVLFVARPGGSAGAYVTPAGYSYLGQSGRAHVFGKPITADGTEEPIMRFSSGAGNYHGHLIVVRKKVT